MIFNEKTAPILQPWLDKGFHDLPFEDYCAIEAANSHGLMDIRTSPKYYQWKKKNPTPRSDSIQFGTLVHWIVLEPEVIETRIRLKKKVDGRTKEGRAYNVDFEASLKPHQVAVDEVTFETVCRVRDDLAAHPYASRLIGKGKKEQVGCWVHPETQVFCKSRLDLLFENEGWIIDVKTTQDASPREFQKQLVNMNYDLQQAFYQDAFKNIYKRKPEGYIFLCVENGEPHDIAIYTPEAVVTEHGRFKYTKALMTYKDCYASGKWPGYSDRAVPLELPGWAVYQEEGP